MEDSVNKLEAMFNKAESDIDYLSRKLDAECSNITDSSKDVNPAEVIKKIDEIKMEYSSIKTEALAIQEAQKEAMLFFRDQLTTLCTAIGSLQGNTDQNKDGKPPELDQLQEILGIQLPSSPADSEKTSESPENTHTIKQSLETETLEPVKVAEDKCPGMLEPELSAYDRRVKSCACLEIDEKEFNSVSSLIRGRVKLAEVNQTYKVLWTHFKEAGNTEPLNSSQMYKMGLRVTGQTGEAKLKVLRALKLLSISKKGDVVLL